MNTLFGRAVLITTLALTGHAALAADPVRETRPVDAKVTRIKLGGVVNLTLHQGAAPALVLSGDKRDVARITTSVQGDTLQIDGERHENNRFGREDHTVQADLTVPNLAEFISQGVGNTTITGFGGDALTLALDGAGNVRYEGKHRAIDARLGGAGGLTLNGLNADKVELRLGGAGRITAVGQTRQLTARLGGVGSLEAAQLHANNVDLQLTGIGGAEVYAKSAASVSLSGMGSATVYGNPATRNSNSNGMGKVSWK